ncbi:MAG: PAS domain-containing protein [Desulfobacterales bacterium]|nr:PAS domain-containing protein [Desulfobacterales bacterium]
MRIVVNRASEKIRLREEARRLAAEMKRTLADLGTEKSRIHTILESLPDGVLVTNSKARVVLINPAFKQLLELAPELAPGGPLEDYVPDQALCELVKDISSGKHVDFEDLPDHEFALSDDKYLLARGKPVLGEKMECLGAVVNLVDISDMKVLDRLKSEFVAKVSHELRSPLATIHEQLAIALRESSREESGQGRRLLGRAQEKTRGLISLIGDLLDLSRIEEGLICHEPKDVQLDDLLKNIVDFLNTRAVAKKQTLSLSLPDLPIPPVIADPLALESIFGNLIANAINYTDNGGQIEVRVEPTGINIRVHLSDNGFGIEPENLDKIFDRFYRVKNDKTRYITGAGLGLPIVKGLVDSLSGIIDIDSSPGKGSTFSVLLPATR